MAATATKKRRNKPPAHIQIALEAAFPKAVEEKLDAYRLSEIAQVGHHSARAFLQQKAEKFAVANSQRFLAFAPRHAAVFNNAAERQVTVLERLNAKPLDEWDDDDRKLERHALNCIKAIHPFLQLAALAMPAKLSPLPDAQSRENPSDCDPEPEITEDDGM